RQSRHCFCNALTGLLERGGEACEGFLRFGTSFPPPPSLAFFRQAQLVLRTTGFLLHGRGVERPPRFFAQLNVKILLAEAVGGVAAPHVVPVHHQHHVELLVAEGPVVFGMFSALLHLFPR
ncbi:unnamed protein product, partial [Ectocarpus sp. 8 AP-2014]